MRNLMALVFGIAGAVLGVVFVNPVLASMLMGRLFSDPQSVATGHLLIFWGTAAVGAIIGWVIGRKIGGRTAGGLRRRCSGLVWRLPRRYRCRGLVRSQ